MCCLFGMMDYGHTLTGKHKTSLLRVLARECEDRGIDASGIAYNDGKTLQLYKRPVAAHKLRIRIPHRVSVVMGHTRMTTQGEAKFNRNNHPFVGNTPAGPFALAHNGILHNDRTLRKERHLPQTDIETDSYIAVQLLEQQQALSLDSLKNMAEQVEGSFCFTLLDWRDHLYFVKGDNPLCLYHYPNLGLYLYASTEAILTSALQNSKLPLGQAERIPLQEGELLELSPDGTQTRSQFQGHYGSMGMWGHWYGGWQIPSCSPKSKTAQSYHQQNYLNQNDQTLDCCGQNSETQKYLDQIKTTASFLGYGGEIVEKWLQDGFALEEIEDFLYYRS